MQTTTVNPTRQTEITILARILGNGRRRLPVNMARYILTLGFDELDKARMHELALYNQKGAITPEERDELLAYAKAGSLLSILKSKARRVLRIKPKKRGSELRQELIEEDLFPPRI
jgi:hypothetical protein